MSNLPVIKKEYADTVVGKLYDAFTQAGLKIDLDYKAYRDAAELFRDRAPQEILDFIEDNNIRITPDMFENKANSPKLISNAIIGFDNYASAIYDVIKGIEAEASNLKPVKRRDIPELKAFNYTGHNDLRIDMDSSNYSMRY